MNKLRNFLKSRSGFATLDASLAISTLMAVQLTFETNAIRQERELNFQTEAEAIRYFFHGVGNHIINNRDTLETQTQTAPVTITAADLIASGSLPGGYSNASSFGKTYYGVVTRDAAFSFTYTAFATGGRSLPDQDIAKIARQSGLQGGAVYRSDDEVFRTNKGQFREPLTDYAGAAQAPDAGDYGLLGHWGINANTPDYVSRSRSAGGANVMNVHLDMNNSDVINASEFRANGVADGAGVNAAKTTTLTGLSSSHPSGSASTGASGNTLALRNANGNMQAEDPIADLDVANRRFVLAQAGSSAPCGDVPVVGQDCGDGTTFIGFHVSGQRLFISNTMSIYNGYMFTQSVTSQFLNSLAVFSRCANGSTEHQFSALCMNGSALSKFVAQANNGDAASYCEDITSNGYSDWFLPNLSEVLMTYAVRDKIPVQLFPRITGHNNPEYYWSSGIWSSGRPSYFRYSENSSIQFSIASGPTAPGGVDVSRSYAFCLRAQ